jgi:nicotinate-nucleotide adenylyltransferase
LGETPVHWLIGADQLSGLHRWHNVDHLLQLVRFVVMRRPGFVVDLGQYDPRVRTAIAKVVESPLMDISSTDIRHRLASRQSVEGLLPERVERYIREHRLYMPN